jgi:hypothetical protein
MSSHQFDKGQVHPVPEYRRDRPFCFADLTDRAGRDVLRRDQETSAVAGAEQMHKLTVAQNVGGHWTLRAYGGANLAVKVCLGAG